jgi:quinol monooxygenase YgiN
MRRLLFSLSALVLVAFPVQAQTPAPAPQHGLKAGSIALVVTGEALPGQMDNFRQLVTRLVATVAEEPGTLVYEFSVQPDQKTYNVMEVYRDSDAVLAHGKHLSAALLIPSARRGRRGHLFGEGVGSPGDRAPVSTRGGRQQISG